MGVLATVAGSEQGEATGTKVGRFMIRRGVLLVKESRPIGKTRDEYGSKLQVETFIVSVANKESARGDVTYSIKLTLTKGDDEETALIDFDEAEEVDRAITFIGQTSRSMAGEKRDYTEVIYATKDNIQFGFFQDAGGDQKGFIQLNPHGFFFVSVEKLEGIRKLLGEAVEHLVRRGAGEQ
jgi:hypothetical protein